jgi:ribosomal protein S18 acetylase RimI-like enzyme
VKKKMVVGGVIVALIMLLSGITFRMYRVSFLRSIQPLAIREYAKAQDRALVEKVFKENFYTLTANPGHDFDLMLEKRSPNKYETKYFGKMDTYMMYDNNKPVGFVSYYMRSSYQGLILFLAIDKEYRGKGYGKKLVQHAINALKKQGAKVVKIATRVDNKGAQRLYGQYFKFTQEDQRNGFVFYRKDV